MDATKINLLIELFKSGRDHTLKIVDEMPESHRFKQLAPGKATPTWLLGHLTRTLDRLVIDWTLQEHAILSDEVGVYFAPEHVGGIAPSTQASDYPDWASLRSTYIEASDRVIAGLGRFSDEDLDKPVPGNMPDDYRTRFPTIYSLLNLITNHDAYHRGQMGLLAKLN